jgi:hypothetical protein
MLLPRNAYDDYSSNTLSLALPPQGGGFHYPNSEEPRKNLNPLKYHPRRPYWILLNSQFQPANCRHQTPQAPTKPIVTSPFSSITGTLRTPPECFSISSNFLLSAFTSKYSAASP